MLTQIKEKSKNIRKKPGPKPTGKGILVGTRLQPDILCPLDNFLAENSLTGRSEAIRHILADWLREHGYLTK